MTVATCGICLDHLSAPVSTPCGHLHCEKCLTLHIQQSRDAMTASCPTCRASFCIASPELKFVPSKYHKFIVPTVRRVFLDAPPAPGLQSVVKRLEERVRELERDKTLLMERCEAQMAASATHALGERDVRQENDVLRAQMVGLRRKYDGLKEKYKRLKESSKAALEETTNAPVHAKKRKSGHAALDNFTNSTEASQRDFAFDTSEVNEDRIPKHPRLLDSPFDPPTVKDMAGPVPVFQQSILDYPPEEPSDVSELLVSNARPGPRRSGLPAGDLFSPGNDASRGGHGSIDYELRMVTIPPEKNDDDDE